MTYVRPPILTSVTTRYRSEYGNIFITVSEDEEGRPREVLGSLSKKGTLLNCLTELVCRLISLHLQQDTPLKLVFEQIKDINEAQSYYNMVNGESVVIRGISDALAHALSDYLEEQKDER